MSGVTRRKRQWSAGRKGKTPAALGSGLPELQLLASLQQMRAELWLAIAIQRLFQLLNHGLGGGRKRKVSQKRRTERDRST